jgi:hypothetical protein
MTYHLTLIYIRPKYLLLFLISFLVHINASYFNKKIFLWGQWGEMNQSLYAHMNNKRKMKKKKENIFA